MRFIKTHAYGNDFVIVLAAEIASATDLVGLARRICDRHRGIGADGLMVVREEPAGPAMRLHNADGSRSEISGNGLRCVAAWIAQQRHLGIGAELTIGTDAGPKSLRLLNISESKYEFRAAMGQPADLREERIEVAGQSMTAVVLRVGNPQCVVLGPATEERLHTIAARLSTHAFFPEGTNVELAEVEAPTRVRILIWERGVGSTEASGTGACAAAVAAAAYGGAERTVDVIAPGGAQHVEWTTEGIWLTGWAEIIATGEIAPEKVAGQRFRR